MHKFHSSLTRGILIALATALSLFPTHSLHAQASTPQLAGIAHAAVRVADLNKSRAFYEQLGFQEAFSRSRGGVPTQSFIKVNDRQFIELYPRSQPSQPIGFMHVCFESADLERLQSAYIARGLSPTKVLRAGAGNLLFTMPGPEEQNLEYTQYMPGSMHTEDRGKHLGTDRISDHIIAVGIEMQDTAAARAFYVNNMAFSPTQSPARSLDAGHLWLALPNQPAEMVAITQRRPVAAFEFVFSVSDLRQTAARLRILHLKSQKASGTLSVEDPDGNRIIFVQSMKP